MTKRQSQFISRNGEAVVAATVGVAAKQDVEPNATRAGDTLPRSTNTSPRPSTSRSTDHQEDRGEGPSTPTPVCLPPRHDPIPVRHDLSPEAMGRETCPICIVDFEEGDDIRVLPCEGKHRFHPACVDQWLLELSSSCPICRQGVLVTPVVRSLPSRSNLAWSQIS